MVCPAVGGNPVGDGCSGPARDSVARQQHLKRHARQSQFPTQTGMSGATGPDNTADGLACRRFPDGDEVVVVQQHVNVRRARPVAQCGAAWRSFGPCGRTRPTGFLHGSSPRFLYRILTGAQGGNLGICQRLSLGGHAPFGICLYDLSDQQAGLLILRNNRRPRMAWAVSSRRSPFCCKAP